MDYFYSSPENISSSTILLIDDEFHHCITVLRKQIGEAIFVLDGMGNCYEVKLKRKGKDFVEGNILSRKENYHEPKIDLTLAVGLLKNPARFDFIVEKATELGVKKIIPMITEHTIAKSAKVERLQKLALTAIKQCGRGFLPTISELQTFEEIISAKENYDEKLVAYEHFISNPKSQTSPKGVLRTSHKPQIVLVGSEGGFSEKEIEQATKNNFQLLSLGERRLRTETAAMVVCTKFLI
ncbi:MAG: 16S rRNA (uracil(1498)-N(3))-methyltransferase [Ignavibacteriales bacterium]|nr:16S rRNA (uracil(1498)-N(3))-methyltransferase [Ignavibacteriales bacterium]